MRKIAKFAPLTILFLIVGCSYYFGGFDYLSAPNIQKFLGDFVEYVHLHPYMASLIFMGAYIVCGISLFPGLMILDCIAGFLFGQLLSLSLVILSATIGAVITFLAVRFAFADYVASKQIKTLEKIKAGFDRHQKKYLLFIRLIPFFPFGLINIASAFLNISLRRYIWTTALGVLPISFFCTQMGTGLGRILEKEGAITLSALFNPFTISAIIGISLLMFLSIFLRKLKPREDKSTD